MIRTWFADVSSLQDPDKWKYYYQKAPLERQGKADKIRKETDKCLSLGVWSLYDTVNRKYGITDGGTFNFSHSGSYVICSIATAEDKDAKTGCDIERIGEPKMNLAARFFCTAEYEYILACRDIRAQADAFYRYWVLKESFMKATRLGTKLPLNAFEISIPENGRPKLIKQPAYIADTYYYQEYHDLEIPYKIAVCSASPNISENIQEESL